MVGKQQLILNAPYNKQPKVFKHEDIIRFVLFLLGATSAVQLIIIITPSVAVTSSILLLSFIVMICCIKRGTKNKGTLVCTHVQLILYRLMIDQIIALSTDVQDVIITAENPVYVVMTKHKTKVGLCENSAYGVLS